MFPSISPKQSFPALEKFDEWNEEKKKIQTKIDEEKLLPEEEKKKKRIYINEREIWYTTLGQNIGNESNGKKLFLRPVLVIKKIGSMFFVVPMTTKWKDNIYHHEVWNVVYDSEYENVPDVSRVQLSQARVIDKWRFSHHIGTISLDDFVSIKQKLKALLLWVSDDYPAEAGDPEGHL